MMIFFHHEHFLVYKSDQRIYENQKSQRLIKKTKVVDNYIMIHYTNFQNSHTIIFRNLNLKIYKYVNIKSYYNSKILY